MSGIGGLAGNMRERVEVTRQARGRDALGAASGEWLSVCRVWASAEPAGRGTGMVGEAASALPAWRLTMRPCPVQVGDRIERTRGSIEVREVVRDPRQPDRVVAIGEERR